MTGATGNQWAKNVWCIVCVCACEFMFVCMYVCVCVNASMYVYIMYLCIYVVVCVYMHVCEWAGPQVDQTGDELNPFQLAHILPYLTVNSQHQPRSM